MTIFEDGFKAIRDLVNQFNEPDSIREDIVQPRNINQPAPTLSGVPPATDLKDIQLPDTDQNYTGIDLDIDPYFDFNSGPEAMQLNLENQHQERAEKAILVEDLGSVVSPQQAREQHWNLVKDYENSRDKGLTQTATGTKFFPIDSIEGEGPDKSMSTKEIGYGIKIPDSWLEDDRNKWPVVGGVPVNVKEGITEEQAKAMSMEIVDKSYKQASNTLTKTWDDMTEMEKAYWADLTYNGGEDAINKNPKAKAATLAGYTVEGLVKSLDYIKAGGRPLRGLLNRRITMYNKAALEISGAPIIEQYVFGDDIRVKFASKFMTKKVSKKYSEKLNSDKDGWFTIRKGGNKGDRVYESNDNFEFWE